MAMVEMMNADPRVRRLNKPTRNSSNMTTKPAMGAVRKADTPR
jgi:hypothetical protein